MPEPTLDAKQKRALADALLACPSMADRAGRDAIIHELPANIQHHITRSDAGLLDVTSTISAALNYPRGLETLIDLVRVFEGDSLPMAEVDRMLAELAPAIREPEQARPVEPVSKQPWLLPGLGLAAVAIVVGLVIRSQIGGIIAPPATATREAVALATLTLEAQAAPPTKSLPVVTSIPTETATPASTATVKPTQTRSPAPTPSPTLQAGATAVGPNEMVLVYVPAGSFWMGSSAADPDADDDEKPQHAVDVAAFWISRTEVTNAQYLRCVSASACAAPRNAEYGQQEFANRPVARVTWYDANAYAQWVGGRLPTEAEWEKACRGEDARAYPWGNTAPTAELLNSDRNVDHTTDVGSYPAGTYGLFDMAGNVWEWTASLDQPYPYQVDDGREDPQAEGARVLRGGSWGDPRWFARCASRYWFGPDIFSDNGGFRVVVPLSASGF